MKHRRGKGRPESVLKRQRPRVKRPVWTRPMFKGLVLGAAALMLSALIYRGLSPSKKQDVVPPALAKADWQFSLKLRDDLPLSEAAQAQIIATARSLIGDASLAELTKAGLAIQKLDAYADVRLVKVSARMIAISVTQRHAALCIEADLLRYISTTGEVYGQVPDGQSNSCPGPTLTGVFEHGRRLTAAGDLTMILNSEERALTKEAVELLAEGRARGFSFAKLEVRRYRGFFAQLLPQGTEVALGRAPFAPKLDKLQGILDKLAKRQEQALRVELDYQGKAFIKLKKM